MKKRLVRISVAVLIGAGLFAGLVVGLIHTLGDRESLYENQPAYVWLCRLTNQDAAVRHQAMSILNQQIIPHLTWVMFQDTNDIALKIELIEKLNKLPNVNIFYTTASVRRSAAASKLGEFGPAASAAVPSLLHALKGEEVTLRGAAAVALGKIQAQPDVVIPLLITYLDDPLLSEAAAEALGEYGAAAKASVPKLISLSTVRDKGLHHAVLEALDRIAPDAAESVKRR